VRHIDDETFIAVLSHLMEHQVLPARVLDATLTCFARVGVAKTTLDDVAREAGCARASVYRCFPGKQPLISALVARETRRLTDDVIGAAAEHDVLADAAVAVLQYGARGIIEHEALRFVLTHEPELLVPYLSFDAGSDVLRAAARALAPAFVRFLDDERATRLAEWLVRIGFSYLCSPEAGELADPLRVRALVEDFVLPGLDRPASKEEVITS